MAAGIGFLAWNSELSRGLPWATQNSGDEGRELPHSSNGGGGIGGGGRGREEGTEKEKKKSGNILIQNYFFCGLCFLWGTAYMLVIMPIWNAHQNNLAQTNFSLHHQEMIERKDPNLQLLL